MSAQIDDNITYPKAVEFRPAAPAGGWKAWQVNLALVLGLLGAGALAASAAGEWNKSAERVIAPGPLGGLYSVQLANGQVYYGVLLEAKPAYIRLGDVYYIQTYQQPNGQPGNRVVSRRKNDWHGPESQTIPADKILTLDAVGPQSQLAKLIQQDKAAN
ncbi:hypothetical protein [Duganella radicis]|uniref:Uncharacterized protein n=1 Tax=Duganella radicis TaxID=551988 RepID=A0A6L6PJ37_9BURK|nr:hypothetical protein [Duganella radicis]MTV38769.1 hypothetical protein [Duganella radicis]